MSDGSDDDRLALHIKDNAPIADPKSRPVAAFKALHIALAGACKRRELGIDPPSYLRGKLKPLSRRRSGKGDLHAAAYIAICDNPVKKKIAKRGSTAICWRSWKAFP
jgi:hypothetical protein